MRVTRRCCLSRSPKNRRRFRPSLPHGSFFVKPAHALQTVVRIGYAAPWGSRDPVWRPATALMGLKDAAVNIFSAHKAAGWTVESRCAGGGGRGGARGAGRGGRGRRGGKARGLHGWRCSWLTVVSLPLLLISPASRGWQHVLYDTPLPLSRELAVFLWGGVDVLWSRRLY